MVQEPTAPDLPTRVSERALLASNLATPPPALRALSSQAGPAVRRALAANPSTPEDVLVALADDERRAIRLAVARNPSAPERALIALVADPYKEVRWTVPLHRNCGPSIQRAVAASEDSMARQNLAGRELANDVAAALATDPDPQVRGRLAAFTKEPELLAKLIEDPSDIVRAGATENKLLSREQLLALAKDPSKRVRGHLAWFRDALPEEARALLARDPSVDVRWNLTLSPQPEPIADVLRNDSHPDVVANMEQWRPEGQD